MKMYYFKASDDCIFALSNEINDNDDDLLLTL
jgi:hypothetical protein